MSFVVAPPRTALLLLSVLTACSANNTNTTTASGGSAGVGGSTDKDVRTGGSATLGGSSATSSSSSTGGSAAAGGSTSTGASTTTGGLAPTGGNAALGGSMSTGGSSVKLIGGSAPTGGVNSTGGNPATGGSQPKTSGGSTATGGGPAMGGTNTTLGGASSTGGVTSANSGGNPSTGGSATAGGAASFKCANLSFAPGSGGKTKPAGAVGGMRVLDWAGFTGAISWTFDDANATQVTDYAQLKVSGVHATFYVVSNWVKSSDITFWKSVPNDGNELGNHTQSHSSNASADDLKAAQTWIQSNLGATAYTMAAPNGDASWATVASQVLLLNRGVADGLVGTRTYAATPNNSSNVAYNLPCFIPDKGAQSSAITAKVDEAKSANKWKTILVHGFNLNDANTYQPVDISQVNAAMKYTASSGVWAENVMNVGAYWVGQTLIPASATTSATWTLPAHFPPNMCVRITTTGGTVMQKGQEVPWDDHGYYQISLDAGSVTIQ